MRDFKNYIGLIIVVVMFFAGIIITIIYINKKENMPVDNYSKLAPVKEQITFFTVVNNVNNYLKYISERKYAYLYGMLDDTYKKKNKITKDNISKKLTYYDGVLSLSAKEISFVELDDSIIYYVRGNIMNIGVMDELKFIEKDFSIIVKIDYKNYTVSFYPTTLDYKADINSINKGVVPKGSYNDFISGQLITNEDVCNMYLNDFFNSIYYESSKAYDNLDVRIKEKYNYVESFQSFVNNNITKFTTDIKSCDVETNTELSYNKYLVYDTNDNYYEFTEYSVMDYNVYFELK